MEVPTFFQAFGLRHGQAALQAFMDSVIVQAESLQDSITKAAATLPVAVVFKQLTEVDNTLARIIQIILFDPTIVHDQMSRLSKELPAATAGIIGERLFALLKDGEFRSGVASVMLDIAEGLLAVYTPPQYPIRRSR